MPYTKKEMEAMCKDFRKSLTPSWADFNSDYTDKGEKLPKPSVVKKYQVSEEIKLERNFENISSKSLDEVINSRRSLRKYSDKELTFQEFSYLCINTCYIKNFGPGYAFGVIPTGGATNSIETYVFVNKVEGLKKGLYHFMKDTNNIELINPNISSESFSDSINGQLRDAAVVFIWTTIPYRAEYRYSYLSHKMIAMEAGHACQNLHLLAESIDCGAVAIAAYNQEKIDSLLELDGEEFVIYVSALGKK